MTVLLISVDTAPITTVQAFDKLIHKCPRLPLTQALQQADHGDLLIIPNNGDPLFLTYNEGDCTAYSTDPIEWLKCFPPVRNIIAALEAEAAGGVPLSDDDLADLLGF